MGNHFKTTNVQMKELVSNMTLVRARWHPDLWGLWGTGGVRGRGCSGERAGRRAIQTSLHKVPKSLKMDKPEIQRAAC